MPFSRSLKYSVSIRNEVRLCLSYETLIDAIADLESRSDSATQNRVSLLAAFFADVRFELIVGSKHFLFMIWAALIEYHVSNHNEQTFSFSGEAASERLLTSNIDQALADPLPKLLLRSPELVLVGTDYSCCLFCLHLNTTFIPTSQN